MDKLIAIPDLRAIPDSRYAILKDELHKEYFQHIIDFLDNEKSQWKEIYPPWSNIYKAFELTPRENVTVVIIWQDPYHQPNQAHWLCFSVPDVTTPPPSLINIFKEIEREYPDRIDKELNKLHGDLTSRAKQGVLLLNSILTVQRNKPLSHKAIGRERFTNTIISTLSDKKQWIVFMLRWKYAQSKAPLIDNQKHLVLTASHPSSLSANQGGRFWNNHFRRCNEYINKQDKWEIQWNIKKT